MKNNKNVFGANWLPLSGYTKNGLLAKKVNDLEKLKNEEIESTLCECCQEKKQSIERKYDLEKFSLLNLL